MAAGANIINVLMTSMSLLGYVISDLYKIYSVVSAALLIWGSQNVKK